MICQGAGILGAQPRERPLMLRIHLRSLALQGLGQLPFGKRGMLPRQRRQALAGVRQPAGSVAGLAARPVEDGARSQTRAVTHRRRQARLEQRHMARDIGQFLRAFQMPAVCKMLHPDVAPIGGAEVHQLPDQHASRLARDAGHASIRNSATVLAMAGRTGGVQGRATRRIRGRLECGVELSGRGGQSGTRSTGRRHQQADHQGKGESFHRHRFSVLNLSRL